MLFPGQGAQSVGMLAGLSGKYPIVSDTWAEASDALGFDMARLVTEDPDEQLDRTEFTQPALVAAGIAVWRVWKSRGGADPALVAGHSLGEYTALVAAGALDFSDALRLTRMRGQAMQAAVAPGVGAMAAIIGLSDDAVRDICETVTAGNQANEIVSPANYNAPSQVVIAGHAQAVKDAGALAREKGAKLVKQLTVSVPSHCALMRSAGDRLQSHLLEMPLREPRITVLHNVDAQPRDDVNDIRKALVGQLAQSVLWTDTIRAMRKANCGILLECGPGKVLTGLNKRIDKDIQAIALNEAEGLRQGLTATTAVAE